jgi:hypothetical protein
MSFIIWDVVQKIVRHRHGKRKDHQNLLEAVFIGLGERDVSPDPHAEASAFRAARDVSLFIVPRMAHMHNFASTRARMWQRLHDWSRAVGAP